MAREQDDILRRGIGMTSQRTRERLIQRLYEEGICNAKVLEVIRLVIPAGKHIPEHRAPGEITVQCLEGRVAFKAGNVTRDLEAGQLLYLSSAEPHSLSGIEDSSVLLTILL